MKIPVLNGAPETDIPSNAALVHCDGAFYYVYFYGDIIPDEHLPRAIAPGPVLNWAIADALRNSSIFLKAFMASSESLPVNTAFTLLLSAINFQNINDLRFAFNALRIALVPVSIGDFTTEDLSLVESLLLTHHFPLDGFNLA